LIPFTRDKGGISRILVTGCILAFALICSSVDTHGKMSSMPGTSGKKLKEIYDMYFLKGSIEKGIEILSEAILAGELRYNRANLQDTVLLMMKDYFVKETKPKTFENLIYHVVDYSNIQVIKKYFSGTGLMVNVNNAIREWETPFSIKIKPEHKTIEVDRSVKFSVEVRNNLNKELREVDLAYEINPEGKGEFDPKNLRFTAREKGTVTLALKAGGARGSATIDIRPLPPPVVDGIDPEKGPVGVGVTLSGKNFDPSPEQNTVLFDNVETVADSASESTLYLKVPHQATLGKKMITVRTPLGEHRSPVKFEVIAGPEPPSMKWPLISSGALVLAGTVEIMCHMKAHDKEQECSQKDIIEEFNTCKSEYDDLSLYEKVSVGVTVVAVAVTGYMWYRYFKERSRYKEETEKLYGKSKVGLEPYKSGFAVVYRF
jgi:hypothetical protein